MNMLHEQQREAHQQAVMQWNAKRHERKQLERDLLKYQVSTIKESRNRTSKSLHC